MPVLGPTVYHTGPPPSQQSSEVHPPTGSIGGFPMGYGPPPGVGEGQMTFAPATPMTMHDQAEAARLAQDYNALVNIINQWNANRLDLFALTLPNEMLEFHGVMRFYYQSHDDDAATGQKVATKCVRVASTATTKLIIETLIEKFRPDMKMLEVPEYALYEIHESGERRLGQDEKPLLVQLNWHKDDREGRFLLRRIDETSAAVPPGPMGHRQLIGADYAGDSTFADIGGGVGFSGEPATATTTATTTATAATATATATTTSTGSFKRKLSKREKKELKKQEKMNKQKNKENNNKDESSVAEKLYTEFPDTSFTRSISNPEAVMRRRRQQKLEKKLHDFRSKDGGPDTGGTLKVYGESLSRDIPYKTLLLSVHDTSAFVVEEMLDKYGIDRKEAPLYCLVQATTTTAIMPTGETGDQLQQQQQIREYYLEDDECPLAILMHHPPSRGSVTFHVRMRPHSSSDSHLRKRKKKPAGMMKDFASETALTMTDDQRRLMPPFLLEMNPDGTEIQPAMQGLMPQRFRLAPNVTEVGSDPAIQSGQCLLLPPAQLLHPRHCILTHTEGSGTVTVTPNHRDAEIFVNNKRIHETTILQHGCVVRFGRPGHCFRFVDPFQERLLLQRQQTMSSVTLPPAAGSQVVDPVNRQWMGRDHILPAVLEFREETEDAFFNAITVNLDVNSPHFKLAPTYTIYMATRFRASTHYRPELVPEERAVRLTEMLSRVADRIYLTVEEGGDEDAGSIAFWMANSSELLHFLKSDRHITSFSHQAQDVLAESVHLAFKQLVIRFQTDLEAFMGNLLLDADDEADGEDDLPSTSSIMRILSAAMILLRKCRVNAALTIQLFSQLFHFINMWTFNQIVTSRHPNYCTHRWGSRLKRRLSRVECWAERQGLELAADCHLARVVQAAHLLLARKNTAEDIASVSSICFKLNSLQLKTLLDKYEPAPDEKPISKEMIETIVRVAENTVDEVTNSEGREVRLEEEFVLQLPFLLPEDGYSCDIVRGVPGGLADFLAPLHHAGLCVMTPQPTSSGFWTIYMDAAIFGPPAVITPTPSEMSHHSAMMMMMNGGGMQQQQQQQQQQQPPPPPPPPQPMSNEPEVQTIQLVKSNTGMGLSIVAAKGVGKDRLGIYVKAVVEGGAAFHDGRLSAGDQLLRVDGQSLVGITQERAAEIMMHTGQVVKLEVAKQGAIYHGLATLLAQPSPLMSPRGLTNGPPIQPQRRPNDLQSQTKVPQSRSMSTLHQEQHTYQNHRPQIPQQRQRPQIDHPPATRSTSIQNLGPGTISGAISNPMGHRQASHPALTVNGGYPQPPHLGPDLDQSYYQNVGPSGQPQQPFQQHMPLRAYHQAAQQQRHHSSSQGSLPRSESRGFPPVDDLHHASPRIAGTPLGSGSGGHVRFAKQHGTTPTGPEKPLRHYSYPENEEEEQQQMKQVLPRTTNGHSRVRFQEKDDDRVSTTADAVGSHLENLRLTSVEREFRRRIAEYGGDGGFGQNADSGSDSEDRRKMPPPPSSKLEQDRQKKIDASMERRQKSREDVTTATSESLRRKQGTGTTPSPPNATPPPPLPVVPPPESTPPNHHQQQQSGAARLDMLVGVTKNGSALRKNSVNGSAAATAKESTPTKRVSFLNPSKEKIDEDEDPNAFIDEAEFLLSSSSSAFDKMDFNKTTGHTPSVIGAQEIYRDPRQKRLQKAEEEKASAKGRDGAKLSFQEKMKLFAAEAGEKVPPNKDKAKISRAQRELESDQEEGIIDSLELSSGNNKSLDA